MSLRKKQSIFAINVAKLITYAYEIGYEITLGEAYRTDCQQILYFEGRKVVKIGGDVVLAKREPKSKTMKSKHRDKLAIDLNLFKDGEYLTDKKSYEPLAKYWSSLHPNNVSGFDWNWDFNHFQM